MKSARSFNSGTALATATRYSQASKRARSFSPSPTATAWSLGKTEFGQGGPKTGAFIDATGQNHDRILVIDELEIHAEFVDDIQDYRVALPKSGYDGAAHGERRHIMSAKRFDEYGRRRPGEGRRLAAGR